jgi:hypothetical protein
VGNDPLLASDPLGLVDWELIAGGAKEAGQAIVGLVGDVIVGGVSMGMIGTGPVAGPVGVVGVTASVVDAGRNSVQFGLGMGQMVQGIEAEPGTPPAHPTDPGDFLAQFAPESMQSTVAIMDDAFAATYSTVNASRSAGNLVGDAINGTASAAQVAEFSYEVYTAVSDVNALSNSCQCTPATSPVATPSASGGFLLYPSRINRSQTMDVYSK